MIKYTPILLAGLITASTVFAQEADTKKKEEIPKNWHQLDPATSGINGISLDKAYEFLKKKNAKSKHLVIAVIDSGIDTLHEDLKPVLWTNKKEIPGNGIDDDKNGYTDDVHGWNFIGGKDGRNVKVDSYEAARVYHKLKGKWAGRTSADNLSITEKEEYETYLRARDKIVGEASGEEVAYMKQLLPKFMAGDSVLKKELGKLTYNANDLIPHTTTNPDAKMVRGMIISISKQNNSNEISNEDIVGELSGAAKKAEAANTPPQEYRKEIVGDDESNFNDRNYGNNDIMASTPFHGTHCAGIIAAARNNKVGIDGIVENVEIMMVRAVPDGDEHDKDIALAIRYAVDNGASIISMSFGKDFSPEKQWVDDAFRYAESKNVLLVHAAGNDNKNVDSTYNYPNPVYVNGSGRASNVITVGASGDKMNGGYTASFSNYGKKEVDVFAPGVQIYSTIPGGTTYGNASGTSMACPVVAGVAGLVLQYYPKLTAKQLKYIIEKSVVPATEKVKLPGTSEMVNLSDISKTGGFVNAYTAVKLADQLSKQKTKPVIKKVKSKKTTLG